MKMFCKLQSTFACGGDSVPPSVRGEGACSFSPHGGHGGPAVGLWLGVVCQMGGDKQVFILGIWGVEGCHAAGCVPVLLVWVCSRVLGRDLVGGIGGHLALNGMLAGCQHDFLGQGSCGARFVHIAVGGQGGDVGCGRRWTDLVVVDLRQGSTQGAAAQVECCWIGGLHVGGSTRGSLGTLGGWFWMAGPWVWSQCCLVCLLEQFWVGPVPRFHGLSAGWCRVFCSPTLGRLFPVWECAFTSRIFGFVGGNAGLGHWEAGWQVGFGVAKCRSVGRMCTGFWFGLAWGAWRLFEAFAQDLGLVRLVIGGGSPLGLQCCRGGGL